MTGRNQSGALFADPLDTDPLITHTVRFLPSGSAAAARPDETLLAAARRAGVVLDAPCAGEGTCGKCGVWLAPDHAERVVVLDPSVLPEAKLREGLVPACQALPLADVEVILPRVAAGGQIQTVVDGYPDGAGAGIGQATHHLSNPHISKQYLPAEDRTLVRAGDEVIGTEPGDTRQSLRGVAVDVGTTTLVASLLDLHSGVVLATESSLNPQSLHAQDVLSRIKTAATAEGLAFLHAMLRDEINAMLGRLAASTRLPLRQVYEVVLSGNTCMLHLVTGAPTASLGKYPYRPAIRGGVSLSARDLRLHVSPFGLVYLPPILGPYVGADITSGLLVTDLERRDGVTLFVDIGTNGELVLADNGRLTATSTAAGPAFEGMNIRDGMRAAPGAVERFEIRPDLSVRVGTIAGEPAVGICGSGLVDVVAELVRVGVVAVNGRMARPGELAVAALEERLIMLDGKAAFRVAEQVYLTQPDVRQLQLAKGALRAGIEMLLEHAGLKAEQVDTAVIAGSFGYHLATPSLVRLGLLPAQLHDRVHFAGNTSRTGAEAFLLDATTRERAHRIVAATDVVELADDDAFQKVFMRSMAFA